MASGFVANNLAVTYEVMDLYPLHKGQSWDFTSHPTARIDPPQEYMGDNICLC